MIVRTAAEWADLRNRMDVVLIENAAWYASIVATTQDNLPAILATRTTTELRDHRVPADGSPVT